MNHIDQNFEREENDSSQTPLEETKIVPKKRPREFRVPLSISILCTLLACLFVFMGTFVSLSLRAERMVNEAYENVSRYDKLWEMAELYDRYYLYGYDEDETADRIAGYFGTAAGDTFASYYTKEEWRISQESSNGNAVGIGSYVARSKDGNIIIARVMANSPAKAAGLQDGDVIVAVDGVKVLDVGYENAVDLVMGEVGSVVSFDVLRGDEEWKIDVVRGNYDPQTVFAETVTVENALYGYVHITQFGGTTPNQFKAALDALMNEGVQGLIFDVRDNPGGDLASVLRMVDYLIPEGPIAHIEGTDTNDRTTYTSDANEIDLPMTVIINQNSASASELFTSALMDYEKAEVVGTTSFGKGCGQSVLTLSDGSVALVTTFLYDPPFSENFNGIGIKPDHAVDIAQEWENTSMFLVPHEEDAQLAKAVDVLHNMNKTNQ